MAEPAVAVLVGETGCLSHAVKCDERRHNDLSHLASLLNLLRFKGFALSASAKGVKDGLGCQAWEAVLEIQHAHPGRPQADADHSQAGLIDGLQIGGPSLLTHHHALHSRV